MDPMLGKATRWARQGGWWWYCCQGHDGRWKDYIKTKRKARRAAEKRAWRRDQSNTS